MRRVFKRVMKMAYGNMGKALEVDLTSGTTQEFELDEAMCRDFIGVPASRQAPLRPRQPGRGASGPDNLLIFATGPLTASASRARAASRWERVPPHRHLGQASCGAISAPS